MSFASNLLSWAIEAARTQAQAVALQAIQKGTQQLSVAIKAHAPDVADEAVSRLQDCVSLAVSGVLSQHSSDS